MSFAFLSASKFLEYGAVSVWVQPTIDSGNEAANKKNVLTLLKLPDGAVVGVNSAANDAGSSSGVHGDPVLLVTFRLAETAELLLSLSSPLLFSFSSFFSLFLYPCCSTFSPPNSKVALQS